MTETSGTAAIPETDIQLYTSGTPNGQKINIALEELGIKYTVHNIKISKNVQKEEWYLRINPNGRIPAIVDKTPKADGKSQEKRVFEGGAIMLYLAQKYDPNHKISYPFDTDKYWEMVEWIVWLQSGIGPMQGQANHFYRYAPEKIQYGIDRYRNETYRLYQVLEDRLAQQATDNRTAANTSASHAGPVSLESKEGPGTRGPWIVGDRCTMADIACFSWINWAVWAGVDDRRFKYLAEWVDTINERPAVKRGLDIPEPFEMKEKMQTKEGEEEYAKMHSQWVMKGQDEDAKKHE
ncbi:MAG: hypothetical protein M1827_001753 [Pycnora praestabilis]|nr:MAG: hypothetical protein M1827_001753 [Pycnora praestabilis]